jgi:hypothetical protein
MLTTLLKGNGYEVEAVTNGATGKGQNRRIWSNNKRYPHVGHGWLSVM